MNQQKAPDNKKKPYEKPAIKSTIFFEDLFRAYIMKLAIHEHWRLDKKKAVNTLLLIIVVCNTIILF